MLDGLLVRAIVPIAVITRLYIRFLTINTSHHVAFGACFSVFCYDRQSFAFFLHVFSNLIHMDTIRFKFLADRL